MSTKAQRARTYTEILAARVDAERLDWMSDGEDTGTSNIYLVWQCMLSHAPGDLRQVIDQLRRKKGKNT